MISMKILFWVKIFSLVIFFIGCDTDDDMKFSHILRHPNGLIVGLPTGYVEKHLENGYQLNEAGMVRSPISITINLASNKPDIENFTEDRIINTDSGLRHSTVYYNIKSSGEVGSGGTEYQFEGIISIEQYWFSITSIQTEEYQVPDFSHVWAVLKSLGYQASVNIELNHGTKK